MCRRAEEPARGQWAPPVGFLECGETLEEGATRETLEETGVHIDPEKLELYAVMNMQALEQVVVSFRVELADKPVVHAGPECTEVCFLSEDELREREVAWLESIGSMPRQLFEEIRTGNFSVQLTSIASKDGQGYRSRSYKLYA